mmetsp:Transcript_2718/g.11643  ORF Transcript_2718/g.11643 Transcript_2718/m.11643 type:complete len:279 (+) Transcript_2718:2025-2861(+)
MFILGCVGCLFRIGGGASEDDANAPVAVNGDDGAEIPVEHLLRVVVPLLEHPVSLADGHVPDARLQAPTARRVEPGLEVRVELLRARRAPAERRQHLEIRGGVQAPQRRERAAEQRLERALVPRGRVVRQRHPHAVGAVPRLRLVRHLAVAPKRHRERSPLCMMIVGMIIVGFYDVPDSRVESPGGHDGERPAVDGVRRSDDPALLRLPEHVAQLHGRDGAGREDVAEDGTGPHARQLVGVADKDNLRVGLDGVEERGAQGQVEHGRFVDDHDVRVER